MFDRLDMQSVIENNNRLYASDTQEELKWCSNHNHNACNSLLSINDKHELCLSCRTNKLIPNLTVKKNLFLWQRIEPAKRRVIYALKRLKLPVVPKDDSEEGIGFNFIANTVDKDGKTKKVFTGHNNGIITLNIEEADDAIREKNRINLGERYRTLEGHLRHELGHYYWDRLIKHNNKELKEFRQLFGDERTDYSESLCSMAKTLHFILRKQPPLGRLGRNLGSLLTYCSHTRNRFRLWFNT